MLPSSLQHPFSSFMFADFLSAKLLLKPCYSISIRLKTEWITATNTVESKFSLEIMTPFYEPRSIEVCIKHDALRKI